MMKFRKSISLFLFTMIIMNSLGGSALYAKAASTTASTTVNGSISASLINVSVPTSLAFTVDPNNESATYSSEAIIKNNTNAPITISLSGGGESFKQATSSAWKPSDYLPGDRNWDQLGKADSEGSLALGLIAKDALQWRVLSRTTTLWVKELRNTSGAVVLGDLNPHTSANITFQILHGNAFSEAKSCVYNIVWSFSLTE